MKATDKPLVLDIDDTFLRTDMLLECLWAGLGSDPWATLRALWHHWRKPADLKRELVDIVQLDVELLPVNPELKKLADQNLAAGRRVILASASDKRLVDDLAASHELDAQTFGTVDGVNMKGKTKAAALIEAFGEGGFDYAGDSRADMAVWPHADNAIIIGKAHGAAAVLAKADKNVTTISGGWALRDLIRALRPHQWVKNVLLFLPMLAAQQFDLATLMAVLLGIVAFSAAASSIYIVNDLLDLEADRMHATKFKRPFASGQVPISVGMATFGILAGLAVLISATLSWAFLAVILVYMALSLIYSLRWKRLRWIDIATLAALYTLRVVAGAAAGSVFVSGFMLVFIFPVFITLGCVKRLTELTLAKSNERLPGRGYARADRSDLLNMAWLGTVGALITFFLYSLSVQAQQLYPIQWMLWAAMVPIALWLVRMVRLGYFGKQDYDPIVFALRDKRGIGLLLIILSMMFYAAGLWQDWLGL